MKSDGFFEFRDAGKVEPLVPASQKLIMLLKKTELFLREVTEGLELSAKKLTKGHGIR